MPDPAATDAEADAPAPAQDPVTQAELLDHSYDGIQEYDNPLPGWWVFLFWACIAFSPFYVVYYHQGVGKLPLDEYAADVQAFNEAEAARLANMGEATDALLLEMAGNPALMAEARNEFVTTCKSCHGEQGQGGIGPNLTDAYWLHGAQPMQILETITEGVPEKGMEAWGEKLSALTIRKLAAFVTTLAGTNPPNPKEPQGERVE